MRPVSGIVNTAKPRMTAAHESQNIESQSGKGHGTRISYRRLLAFFLPLAATPFLISSTHNIINAALARLPAPEITIAVFSVVKSFTNAIKAPVLISGQISTAIADSRQSYVVTTKFVWGVAGFYIGVLLVLGYTPVGGLFLRHVMGLHDPAAIAIGYRAMRITAFLPIVEALRDSNRGILIARQRTGIVSIATLVRLVAIVGLVLAALATRAIPGIELAAITWAGGIGVEALVVFGSLFLLLGSPLRAAEAVPQRNAKQPTTRSVFAFFLPLAIMVTLRSALHPLIQAGIARGVGSATHALAVYGVTWGLVLNVVAPLQLLHNCSIVFAPSRDHASWPRVLWFCATIGALMTAILLVLALTPAGGYFFTRVLGVSEAIASEASRAVLAFSLLPLFWAYREAYWGVMMRRQKTGGIGVGKAVNVISAGAAMLLLFGPLRGVVAIPPSIAGALSLTFGELVETVLVVRAAVREDGRPNTSRAA